MTIDSTITLATIAIIATGVLVAGILVLSRIRRRGRINRALDLVLFLVTVPRYVSENKDELAEEGEEAQGPAALMENFYRAVGSMSDDKGSFKYGKPYIAFEMAVHHVGEEIYFYAAVPRDFASAFEKRIHGTYPAAHVEKVKDYNIFDPEAFTIGSVAKLKEDPILPIQTYKELKFDTLDQITTALSKISERNEGAAIQILVTPSGNKTYRKRSEKTLSGMKEGKSFKKALSQAKKKESFFQKTFGFLFSSSKSKEDELKKSGSDADEEVLRVVKEKASNPAFDVNLRIVVSAGEERRARELLSEIKGSFEALTAPYANKISFKDFTGKKIKDLAFRFSFRIFSAGEAMYLSSEELASIFHLPLGGVAAPRVKYLKSRPVEPPTDLPKHGVTLGLNHFRGVETTVKMADDDRRRHLYLIGQTGTGKSSLMKNMVAQDIRDGKGVCVVDPHGDFADYALGHIPEERFKDVVYFNPGETKRIMGLNMLEFDPAHPEQKTFIVNELLNIFNKLYDLKQTGGPLFEQYFRNSVLLVMDDAEHEPPTFAAVSRVLADEDYRRDKLSRETNPLVKQFWQEQAEKAGGEASLSNMVPYVTSKFDQFLSNDFMRPIINQPKSSFDFRKVMDEGKILVVNLAKGRIGDLNANLLGMIIVGRLLMSALSRVDVPEKDRRDFYLYVDEFQNFTTDSIATILSEARKYRLDLTIAHQFIKQLPENIRDAVFGNVGSTISFRVGAEDAEFLEKQFLPAVTAHDLGNVDNFNAYVRLLINNQTSRAFNIKTIKPEEGDDSLAQRVKQNSLEKFGRPREEVEEEIRGRYKKKEKPAGPLSEEGFK